MSHHTGGGRKPPYFHNKFFMHMRTPHRPTLAALGIALTIGIAGAAHGQIASTQYRQPCRVQGTEALCQIDDVRGSHGLMQRFITAPGYQFYQEWSHSKNRFVCSVNAGPIHDCAPYSVSRNRWTRVSPALEVRRIPWD